MCDLNLIFCSDVSVRSHINWRGERSIPIKGVETSS